MFSLSSQAMGRAECQPLLGCALPMDFSLHLDSYKYLRNCHFFQTPVGLKDRGKLWNPVARGFNHKSVQTGSIPWASENAGVLVQGSTCHLKGRIQGHQPLASHRVSGAPSGPPPKSPQQNK